MLRINLLPPYIYEGKKRFRTAAVWALVVIFVIVGLMMFKSKIDGETADINAQATAKEPDATKADKYAKDASDTNAKSAVVRGKADFVSGAQKYDTTTYQEVVSNVARYTWPRVVYSGINASGQTVDLPAFAPSLSDVGHYIMYMERNPNISRVDISLASIPGFPVEGGPTSIDGMRPAGHDFQVSLALVKPIAGAPSYPAGGGGGACAGNPMGGGGAGGGGSSGSGSMIMGGGAGVGKDK